MSLYQVENQWGGAGAPWHQGGKWILGARSGQNVVAIDIQSPDGGETFQGTMTYAGEGPIGFRATRRGADRRDSRQINSTHPCAIATHKKAIATGTGGNGEC